ncbi:hypothetical protein TBK1r_26020 [Stieleria magnilauensis]|uniref:Uncharacterized protein n=1 Tax=Stieleria magnilauensis TaxID=2527963 RepID=A0ABX5XQM3_9BACT|nr:hypothetical protein TBK1r_26020 [Planctomycetes bacterium TBK1r]
MHLLRNFEKKARSTNEFTRFLTQRPLVIQHRSGRGVDRLKLHSATYFAATGCIAGRAKAIKADEWLI